MPQYFIARLRFSQHVQRTVSGNSIQKLALQIWTFTSLHCKRCTICKILNCYKICYIQIINVFFPWIIHKILRFWCCIYISISNFRNLFLNNVVIKKCSHFFKIFPTHVKKLPKIFLNEFCWQNYEKHFSARISYYCINMRSKDPLFSPIPGSF